MDQSLGLAIQFSCGLRNRSLPKVCHREFGEADTGIAGVRQHKPRLRAHDHHEGSDIEFSVHIECLIYEVSLYYGFLIETWWHFGSRSRNCLVLRLVSRSLFYWCLEIRSHRTCASFSLHCQGTCDGPFSLFIKAYVIAFYCRCFSGRSNLRLAWSFVI